MPQSSICTKLSFGTIALTLLIYYRAKSAPTLIAGERRQARAQMANVPPTTQLPTTPLGGHLSRQSAAKESAEPVACEEASIPFHERDQVLIAVPFSAVNASPPRNISRSVRVAKEAIECCHISKADEPSVMEFSGYAHKSVNGPILSTSRTVWHEGSAEYRVTHFEWQLNYGSVRPSETVDSDICLTIFDKDKETSLESGEELLCTHEQAYMNGSVTAVPGRTSNSIPLGGFPYRPGQRLNVASVSNIYPVVREARMFSRLQCDPRMLAIRWSIRLERADTRGVIALSSTRSPRRDRSFTTSLIRQHAPSTPYRNMGSKPVRVVALGLFLSSIAPPPRRGLLELRALVNDTIQFRRELPAHEPKRTTGSSSGLIRLGDTDALELGAGDVLRVEVIVRMQAPSVYDAAVFILSDAAVGVLQPLEVQLFPDQVDLNGDGFPDLMDYTSDGTIWAELTKVHCSGCRGAHDTQFEWTSHPLPWDAARFSSLVRLTGSTAADIWKVDDKTPHMRVEDRASGLCLQLFRPSSEPKYDVRYCYEDPKLPKVGKAEMSALADFDGDGWPDRLRVRKSCEKNRPCTGELWLAHGSHMGLMAPEIFWTATSAPDFMYVWPAGEGVGVHAPPARPGTLDQAGSLVLLQQGHAPALSVHSWRPLIFENERSPWQT